MSENQQNHAARPSTASRRALLMPVECLAIIVRQERRLPAFSLLSKFHLGAVAMPPSRGRDPAGDLRMGLSLVGNFAHHFLAPAPIRTAIVVRPLSHFGRQGQIVLACLPSASQLPAGRSRGGHPPPRVALAPGNPCERGRNGNPDYCCRRCCRFFVRWLAPRFPRQELRFQRIAPPVRNDPLTPRERMAGMHNPIRNSHSPTQSLEVSYACYARTF